MSELLLGLVGDGGDSQRLILRFPRCVVTSYRHLTS